LIFLEKKAIAFWMQIQRKMGRVARGRGGGEARLGGRLHQAHCSSRLMSDLFFRLLFFVAFIE